MARLTVSIVESLKGYKKTRSESVPLGGSLCARGLGDKVRYYYVYRDSDRKVRIPFGDHHRSGDETGSRDSASFTLAGARKRAVALASLRQQFGDLQIYLRDQKETKIREIRERERLRILEEQNAADFSLKQLCLAYATQLKLDNKISADDVRRSFEKWVITAHPTLAATKASDIKTEDVLLILRTIIDAGHKTTVNRVRSYISAAFNFGIGSDVDPTVSAKAKGFRLSSNPVAAIKRVAKFESAGQRTLSGLELGEFVRRLEAIDKPRSQAMLLCLRLGGQRVKQLLRASKNDYNSELGLLTLFDPKGRRLSPRMHVLPVIETVKPLLVRGLNDQHPTRSGLFSGLTIDSVSKTVRQISKEMEEQGAEPFTLRDIRRTCETMLASMGVSKDKRAQLQSHGLGGVQDRHYDRHDYIDEKRNVLSAWNQRLDALRHGESTASNVVRISHD